MKNHLFNLVAFFTFFTFKETIIRLMKNLEDFINEALKIYSKDLIGQLFVHPYTKIEYISNGRGVERKAAPRYSKTLGY